MHGGVEVELIIQTQTKHSKSSIAYYKSVYNAKASMTIVLVVEEVAFGLHEGGLVE